MRAHCILAFHSRKPRAANEIEKLESILEIIQVTLTQSELRSTLVPSSTYLILKCWHWPVFLFSTSTLGKPFLIATSEHLASDFDAEIQLLATMQSTQEVSSSTSQNRDKFAILPMESIAKAKSDEVNIIQGSRRKPIPLLSTTKTLRRRSWQLDVSRAMETSGSFEI